MSFDYHLQPGRFLWNPIRGNACGIHGKAALAEEDLPVSQEENRRLCAFPVKNDSLEEKARRGEIQKLTKEVALFQNHLNDCGFCLS